jgi:hypothetical protein
MIRTKAPPMKPTQARAIASWAFQLIAAAILAQTLFFKFSGAEESKYIFSALGVEPWGRVATGLVELVAAVLLLTRCAATSGALLALALMTGPSAVT